MSRAEDLETLWLLQRRFGELVSTVAGTDPRLLELAAEMDKLINRMMGVVADSKPRPSRDD